MQYKMQKVTKITKDIYFGDQLWRSLLSEMKKI